MAQPYIVFDFFQLQIFSRIFFILIYYLRLDNRLIFNHILNDRQQIQKKKLEKKKKIQEKKKKNKKIHETKKKVEI